MVVVEPWEEGYARGRTFDTIHGAHQSVDGGFGKCHRQDAHRSRAIEQHADFGVHAFSRGRHFKESVIGTGHGIDPIVALLLRAFLAADKPVLGICRGIQVMNAVLGGDLYQDIKPFEHLPHNGHWAKVHTVTVRRGTLLSRILGQDTVLVNSQHHQAVDRVAPGFTLAALSEDGIVEAIEKPDAGFCLGVQWHPEWLSDADPAMQSLFDAFVNACSK